MSEDILSRDLENTSILDALVHQRSRVLFHRLGRVGDHKGLESVGSAVARRRSHAVVIGQANDVELGHVLGLKLAQECRDLGRLAEA